MRSSLVGFTTRRSRDPDAVQHTSYHGVPRNSAWRRAEARASLVAPLLPYALAFAAGAMLFVVIEELIPEAQQSGNNDLATASALIGFTLMMVLDLGSG